MHTLDSGLLLGQGTLSTSDSESAPESDNDSDYGEEYGA